MHAKANTRSGTTFRALRFFLLAVSLLLVSLFAGACAHSTSPATEQKEDRLRIVTSIFAPYDFARSLAGDVADVTMLVPPGAETHSFEPTPADIITLNTADVFIYVGGESDAWLERIIDSLDNPDLVLIKLTDLVTTLEEEALEGMDTTSEGAVPEHDTTADAHAAEAGASGSIAEEEHTTEEGHEHGADEAAMDEHVWTSLRNAQQIVQAFETAFSELDPEHSTVFHDKATALIAELDTLDKRIANIVQTAKRKTLVVADRFPFRYFAEDYGLECFAAFPGCSTAVDTNPETIAFLINKVTNEGIPLVFYIELSDERIADTVSEATGAETRLFHAAHNISQKDFDAGATYLTLMENNADNLEVALN